MVLDYIATHPGASNREIAQGAGAIDEGQLSKLLRRAQDLGLIVDRRDPRLQGAAREWHLTPDGESTRAEAQATATTATSWDAGSAHEATTLEHEGTGLEEATSASTL